MFFERYNAESDPTLQWDAENYITDFKNVRTAQLNKIGEVQEQNSQPSITRDVTENVNQSFKLKEDISSLKTPTERTAIERQIQATDAQIDQLVYQLYGLTEEEIKIVEETTSS